MARKRPRTASSPESSPLSPPKSPRRRRANPKSPHGITDGSIPISPKSPRKRLLFGEAPLKLSRWNPRDPTQVKAVKEALHMSWAPGEIACREEEQRKVLEFCKGCVAEEKTGSLYVCGCPGTGKTLSVDRVKDQLLTWTKKEGFPLPQIIAINCTTLSESCEIFRKILGRCHLHKKNADACLPLRCLQDLYSEPGRKSTRGMILLIIDEMDYLITKDGTILHELFMLTTFSSCKLILIGISNAIDLAEKFLPGLESLNCKPKIITFRAYSKDEIIEILQQRLAVLGYDVFQPIALEFCARKVAAASGDMRRALGACLSAVELFEAEMSDSTRKEELDIVNFEHMDMALSKAFRSPVMDIIQSLPQHQQIVLCSVVKMLRIKKSSITIGELNRYYLDTCRSVQVPALGMLEFSSMCQVLSDQGFIKLPNSRQEKMGRVSLLIDSADITHALKEIRFFRSCLV